MLPPLPSMPPSHLHAPFASACRLVCPRFRMPLSHAAWRFRTRTHHHHHHASRPHHASRQSHPPFCAFSCAFAFACACAFAFACAFHHHPHAHIRAHTRPITNRRCRFLLQTASHHRNQQAHSRKLNVRRPHHHHHQHTHPHATLPQQHGTWAVAQHRCLARALTGTYGQRKVHVRCAHCK